MSGPKQHHIPQFLLRSFAIPAKGKTKRVNVFSKDKVYISPTRDVAAERHFYSEPTADGADTLDDVITAYENTLADQVRSLCKLPFGRSADPLVAAEVVAHLTIRNAHLRGTFTSGLQSVVAQAIDVFCNEANLRTLLGVDAREFPPFVASALDEHIVNHPRFSETGLPRAVLHKVAFAAMRENFTRFVIDKLPYFSLHWSSSRTMSRSTRPKAIGLYYQRGSRLRFVSLHWLNFIGLCEKPNVRA